MKKLFILFIGLMIAFMSYGQTSDGSSGTQSGLFLKKSVDGGFIRYRIENSNNNGYAGLVFIADDDTVYMQVDTTGAFIISPFDVDSIFLTKDDDTIRINPGAELYVIDIEVEDDRKFAIDSTGILVLEEGGTFDNNTNNTFEWNENSDELIWTFGSNIVTASSGDVTFFDYGTIDIEAAKVAADDSLCVDKFRFTVVLDTLCSITGTDTLRIHPAR